MAFAKLASFPQLRVPPHLQRYIPTRTLLLLIGIGMLDMLLTSVLWTLGLIDEMNPLMRFFLNHSTTLFLIIKGGTLFAAWFFLARYARTDLKFVRRACIAGSAAYIVIWATWTAIGFA